MSTRAVRIQELYRARPRSRFVRLSLLVLSLVVLVSWCAGDFDPGRMFTPRQQANAARFVAELQPWPLQQATPPLGVVDGWRLAGSWFGRMWQEEGAAATATTLAISLVSILLAGLWGGLLSLPAASNFARREPFVGPHQWSGGDGDVFWRLVYLSARGWLVLVRSVPEYIWAFLLLAVYGPTVWPLILALAWHNTGILGKLTAEVTENADTRAPAALRTAGSGRGIIAVAALMPLSLPRFLLYFFYRWETCVRESTVLGMLGVASLGFGIVQARARNAYDEMVFFILCGVVLVVVGEMVSLAVRYCLRRA